jgi:hypothetical protein
MMRNAKDAQRMYNYNASKEIEVNALAPLAPITAMVEQIKGHEDRYRTRTRWRMPTCRTTRCTTRTAVDRPRPAAAARAAADAVDGDHPGEGRRGQRHQGDDGAVGPGAGRALGEKSGKAINARKTESDMGSFHYVDNVSRALRYAGTIALEMGAEIIDSKRIVRILGEDGEPDHIIVDPDIAGAVQGRAGPGRQARQDLQLRPGQVRGHGQHRAELHHPARGGGRVPDDRGAVGEGPGDRERAHLPRDEESGLGGAEEAVTLLKALLPPPAQQALEGSESGDQPKSRRKCRRRSTS